MGKKDISTVAVYVRKSREDETDETLNRQQAVLVELCIRNGWNYKLFKEVGSSQDLDRLELQAMLGKVSTFHFDAVVVADLDRLSRNVIHFGQIKLLLVNASVLVVTPSKIFDFSNESDDMFSDFMSVIAKSEYQQIKKRLVRGTRQSAKQGNWVGSKVPIGYKYNPETKHLELTEDAPVIKRIFDLYVEGKSTKDIAFQFTHENEATSVGMIWSPAGIARILNNTAYAGHSLYGKTKSENGKRSVKTDKDMQILVENTHDPIVDIGTWEQVQQIKSTRNTRPAALKLGKHKFSGLIRCGKCGSIHSFQTSKYGRKRIASCQTRLYADSLNKYTMCENSGSNMEPFEKLFFTYFKKYVIQLEQYLDLIKQVDPKDNKSSEREITTKGKQVKKLQNDIKRIQQGFIMEIFTEQEAHLQIKQLKEQIELLETQIQTLEKQEVFSEADHIEMVLNNMKQFLEGVDEMEEREANNILTEFVDTILYTKTSSEIELDMVMKDLSAVELGFNMSF